MNQVTRLLIYIGLGTIECELSSWRSSIDCRLCSALGFLFSLGFLLYAGLNASKRLHAPLIHNLMRLLHYFNGFFLHFLNFLYRSPVAFFDTTPLGRILNRCSKDIDTIDSQLPMNTKYFVMCIYSVSVHSLWLGWRYINISNRQIVTTLLVIVISTPLFIVVIIPLTVIYILFLVCSISNSDEHHPRTAGQNRGFGRPKSGVRGVKKVGFGGQFFKFFSPDDFG